MQNRKRDADVLNIEWYMKVAAALQKAIQCKFQNPDITGSFFQEGKQN